MTKTIYATQEGAQIAIGNYGTATTDNGVIVPDTVAAELSGRKDLRIELPADLVAAAEPEPAAAAEEPAPRNRRDEKARKGQEA